MSEQTFSRNPLLDIGQIRLAELSVFNWGSFNGLHTAPIDPMGTLITGDNGAGKTTFIDGLMTLLIPPGKVSFNVAAAQGDRSDRSLLSYMRGSFGSAHDGAGTRVKSKRESAVVTGLRALYKSDNGLEITLAALFWTTQSTNALADVKRVYVVSERDLSLKEMLDAFGDGNSRSLKQWLRDEPLVTCCDENFADYQELYRKLLYIDNKNAPALLSRALGLKKIDDLTALIRELVLEPSFVKEDARKAVDEFGNLVAIHNKLVDARAQNEHLAKLPELSETIQKARDELANLIAEKSGLSVYFAEIFMQLWNEKIDELDTMLAALALKIKQTEEQERDATQRAERRHEEYLRFGGDKIESLQREINHARERLNGMTRESSRYQADAKALTISPVLEESTFLKNQSEASLRLTNIESDNEACQDRFATVSGEYSRLQESIKALSQELKEIATRPDSNIDLKYQQLRDNLVQSLSFRKEQCVFLGELIDVDEPHKGWQGAIERALGGLRTTLAVPQDCYSMVTRWLNARHTGLHIRVQVVEGFHSGDERYQSKQSNLVEFKTNGYLKKLVWRDHPYQAWLKNHLQRFDLQCVSNTEELDRTPFSMTQEGLIQRERGRFEKKDQSKIDDPKYWSLGFSNKSRLAILNQDKNSLSQHLAETVQLLSQSRQDLASIGEQKRLWAKIQDYHWDDINAPYGQKKLSNLQADLQELEQSGGQLDKAKSLWAAAKAELSKIQAEKNRFSSEKGSVQSSWKNAKQEQDKALAETAKGLPETSRQLLFVRVGTLNQNDLGGMSELKLKIEKDLERSLESCRNRVAKSESMAIEIMSSFRGNEKWQVITVDWRSDIGSLSDYLNHLYQLENEGLPSLVEKFAKHLNKHATQSLARIKTKLESEREEIVERIDIINHVLQRTEFRPGSHLKLGSKKEKFPHVQDFENHLRLVLSQATSDDHEARFQQLVKVVGILEKASSPGTSSTLESLRLLDPRYQMSFYAEEIDANTGEIRDVLESSSGKSGGEKESFAGTIVAASLAYVLTPEGCDRPVYCTVFLDEAFSNTADAVSRRVLRVFKELHIHVNLITPYKNLNLARESARLLLIAERNPENHDSHLYEVTWAEIDRRRNEGIQQKLVANIADFGLKLETLPQVVNGQIK